MKLPFRITRTGVVRTAGIIPSIAAILYFVAGFALRIAPDPPPEFRAEAKPQPSTPSVVVTPVDVDLRLVADMAETALSAAPLVTGSSEHMISDKIGSILGLAPPERSCKPVRIVKTITEVVPCKKSTNPLDFIGKAAECFWNNTGGRMMKVTREVVINTVECTPLQQLTGAFSTKPILTYRVTLKGLELFAGDDSLRFEADTSVALTLRLKGDYWADNIPAAKTRCTFPVQAKSVADAAISLRENGAYLDVSVRDFGFSIRKGVCRNSFGSGLDAPRLEALLKGEVGEAITNAVRDQFQNALDEQSRKPVASEQVRAGLALARKTLSNPIPILPDPGIWLSARPSEFLLSPDIGPAPDGAQKLRVTGGLAAQPILQLGKPAASSPDIPLRMARALKSHFALHPEAHLPLHLLEAEVEKIVTAYVEEKSGLRLRNLKAHAYQSGDRVVIGLAAHNIGWLNIRAALYLTAQPVFDANSKELTFRDLKLDVESSEALVARVGWYAETALEQILEPALRFPLNKEFNQITDLLRDFSLSTEAGQLDIQLKTLDMSDFWIDNNVLKLSVKASGTSRIDLKNIP